MENLHYMRISLLCFSTAMLLLMSAGAAHADCTSPASPEGGLNYDTVGDKYQFCDGTNWLDIGTGTAIFEVTGGAGSEVVSSVNANAPYTTADFVFGSPQLADDANVDHRKRMFFDKSKAAFRAGQVWNNQWDDANVGNNSVVFGFGGRATGNVAIAMGNNPAANGDNTVAIGSQITSSGSYSMALGRLTTASATDSIAIGLGNAAGAVPEVSGTSSFGIFMGDQSSVNFSAANSMGLFGGTMVIDPAVPATQLTARGVLDLGAATDALVLPSGTDAQRPTGIDGMVRFNSDNDAYEVYSTTAADWVEIVSAGAVTTGSTTALDDVTAADGTATINNAANAINWDWALTAAGSAFTFGENTAATGGSDDQYILSAETLAASTAIPLFVNNLGAGDSFRVDDGAADTTPFVIDGDGNVGIGTVAPAKLLHISGDDGDMVLNQISGSNTAVDIVFSVDDVYKGGIGVIEANEKLSLAIDLGLDGVGGLQIAPNHSSTPFLTMEVDGDIGIGTTTPATLLDVAGTIRVADGGEGCAAGVAGAMRYNTNTIDYCNGTTWTTLAASGGAIALDDITAADGTATINNAANAINWDWALTAAGSAFTFGENTAATGGSDDQYILSAETLATSTAIPLFVNNLGAGDSFRVDDTAADTTPFIIDNAGQVGIGIAPTAPLHIEYAGGTDTTNPAQMRLINSTSQGSAEIVMGEDVNGSGGSMGIRYFSNAAGSVNLLQFGEISGATLTPRVTIDRDTNRMGIGTTTPSGTLHTVGGNVYFDGGDVRVDGGNLTVRDSVIGGTVDLRIRNTTAQNSSRIVFEEGSQGDNFSIKYNTDGGTQNALEFIGDTTVRMRVERDTLGVGIGDFSSDTIDSALHLASGDIRLDGGAANEAGCIRFNDTADELEYSDDCSTFTAINSLGGGGGLWTDNTTHITRETFHVIDAGQTSDGAGLDSGGGDRAFYHSDKGALRGGDTYSTAIWDEADIGTNSFAWGIGANAAGFASAAFGDASTASGTESFAAGDHANATGAYSVALGDYITASGFASLATGGLTRASGYHSTAMGKNVRAGNGTAGNGLGDGSFAIGLMDDAVTITTQSQVTGIQSFGIFMGDQDGLVMSAANTMGLFGGQMVIDPAVPATQLTARGVLDLGAATDALVLPSGTDAQRPTASGGMLRYNTTATPNDLLEYYDAETTAWVQLSAGGSSTTALDDVTAADGTATINNAANAINWDWALTAAGSAFTFGENTAATGGSDDQYILSAETLAASTAIPLFVNNLGAGASFRVDDTASDTTPFVIDSAGNVGIGTVSPSAELHVADAGDATLRLEADTDNVNEDDNPSLYMSQDNDGTSLVLGMVGVAGFDSFNNAYTGTTQNAGLLATSVSNLQFGSNGAVHMSIEATSGDIGIGTNAPSAELHVADPGDVTLFLEADTDNVNEDDNPSLYMTQDGGTTTFLQGLVAAAGFDSRNNAYTDTTINAALLATSDDLQFGVSGAVRMSIEATSGDIGIGTNAPSTHLDVAGTVKIGNGGETCSGGETTYPGSIRYNSTTDTIEFCKDNAASADAWTDIAGSGAALDDITAADGTNTIANGANAQLWNWALSASGQSGIVFGETTASTGGSGGDQAIVFVRTLASSTSMPLLVENLGAGLSFAVTDEATDSTAFVVDADGNVGIKNSSPGVALDVTGDIEYTGTITDVSDMRLKDNIEPLIKTGSLLERINQIDTYSFTMKDDESGRTEFGVMAQELENIFPELVHTAKDEIGTKSVNYVGLIAPMIEATKELKAENAALKAEISELKSAQHATNESLNDISEQVALLNKVVVKDNTKQGSALYMLFTLIFMLVGMTGFMVLRLRRP